MTKLNLYDPLTLLAALDGPANMLFKPRAAQATGRSLVEVIDAGEVEHSEKAKLLMSGLAKSALAPDASMMLGKPPAG